MNCDVGAVAIVYQEQVQSSIEMIKSFRNNNPNNTIVLCTDGIVKEVNNICEEYNCSSVINNVRLGYPASEDIEIPLEYFRRILISSTLVKEKYFINLEPDCLVTGKLTVPYENYEAIISQDANLQWIYYFEGNKEMGSKVITSVIEYYKQNLVYYEPLFDKIMGGGGDIYNKNITDRILSEWLTFKNRSYKFKQICEPVQKIWYHDFLVSLQIPFYFKSRYGGPDYMTRISDLKLSDRIFHRYKKFYK